MPKAYAVVTYRSVSDPEKLTAYAKLAGPAVAHFGARFLARGNAAVAPPLGVCPNEPYHEQRQYGLADHSITKPSWAALITASVRVSASSFSRMEAT